MIVQMLHQLSELSSSAATHVSRTFVQLLYPYGMVDYLLPFHLKDTSKLLPCHCYTSPQTLFISKPNQLKHIIGSMSCGRHIFSHICIYRRHARRNAWILRDSRKFRMMTVLLFVTTKEVSGGHWRTLRKPIGTYSYTNNQLSGWW